MTYSLGIGVGAYAKTRTRVRTMANNLVPCNKTTPRRTTTQAGNGTRKRGHIALNRAATPLSPSTHQTRVALRRSAHTGNRRA